MQIPPSIFGDLQRGDRSNEQYIDQAVHHDRASHCSTDDPQTLQTEAVSEDAFGHVV